MYIQEDMYVSITGGRKKKKKKNGDQAQLKTAVFGYDYGLRYSAI